jgi:hypothetical protein
MCLFVPSYFDVDLALMALDFQLGFEAVHTSLL